MSDAHRGLPARLIIPLTLLTNNTAIMDALEARIGRVGIPVQTDGRSHADMVEATAAAVREFGELLAAHADALTDARVTPAEREKIRREAYEAMQAIAALVGGHP